MNTKSMIRTFAFAGVGILSTLLAIASNYFTKPARTDGEGDYGRDFNPDFTDAGKATSMLVAAWDDDTATAKKFAVEYKEGWKIPTFHDYPADGKDQLSKAAASVIGLKRGSLASRSKADHERLGVIDPLDQEDASTSGRGTRIKLTENDVTLADFIVGKKVEGSEEKVYLRKFGEDKVYKVAAKFDVSTKFADWAETDLLKVSGSDITRVRGSRPIIEAKRRVGDDVVELSREKFGDPWKLAGLDDAAEELKTTDVDTMVSTLDDLRLVGVRPRPALYGKPILNSELRVSRETVKSLVQELAATNRIPASRAIEQRVEAELESNLMGDLGEKGFFVINEGEEGERQVISREGELGVGTRDGVFYRLSFGSVFSGNEEEIETGIKGEAKADGKQKKKKAANEKPDDPKKSRYLIVRVSFDEKLLPPPPTEPIKPTPPPGVEPLADPKGDADPKKEDADGKKEEEADGKKKDADEADGAKGEDTVADNQEDKKDEAAKSDKEDLKKPAEVKPDDTKKAEKKEDAQTDKPKVDSDETKTTEAKKAEPKRDLKAEYFEAIKRYDAEKGRFVGETKAHEAKVAAGQEKVKELNDRFGDWYYVISNDSFDKLRLSRADLVKSKEKKPEEKKPEVKIDSDKEDGDAPAKPATKEEKPTEKKETGKADADKKDGDDSAKPATKEDQPAEKKLPEKTEADKKEPEKKESEKPAADDK
ncbi:MAG: hypothetical protein ACKV2Q_35855 [Planctomycetaceae bacterium]